MRSALFVPGDSESKLAKALACGADALIIDLEDSVAPAAKARARDITTRFLRASHGREPRPRLFVRVNALTDPAIDADLDAVMPCAPDAIVLPKSLGGASIQQLGVKLAVHEAQNNLPDGATRIIAIATENARAMFGLESYAGCSARLEGLAWGGEDLSADLGAQANRLLGGAYSAPYVLARSLTLIAACAARVTPIDSVFADFRDTNGLRDEAMAGARDGFCAKLAIHPAQIPIIHEAFTPSAEAVAQSLAVIAAFDASPGAGVVALNGAMLDRPHYLRATSTLARAKASRNE
jgi:citrate lyase subunit beta / citryl-CoA lyase